MAKKKPEEAPAVQPPSDDSKVVRAHVNREVYTADDYTMLYSNDTQVQLSPWDVRLIFGVITDPPSGERKTFRIKQVGEVHMSPEHAKRVALILAQQVKRYEETVGVIPSPD